MSVSVGSDTYGRIKAVGGTPIVTKFAMVSGLPLWPQQSFYFVAFGPTQFEGIPFIASSSTTQILGLRLARVDRLSVVFAYIRGVFGALAIIGFFAIIPGIMYLTGERLDAFAILIFKSLCVCFCIGAVGGVLSYAAPFTPRREAAIRLACGEILGVCADPARLSFEEATALDQWLTAEAPPPHIAPTTNMSRMELLSLLVRRRLDVALARENSEVERETDEILNLLSHAAI